MMSNTKELRQKIMRQAGWREVYKCKFCWQVSRETEANNLNCPRCGGPMTERGWLPPKQGLKAEVENLNVKRTKGNWEP